MLPIILIPARMASTRLPGKPLADIGGMPMIVHVWKRAMQAQVGEVVVACDSPSIAEAITKAGGKAVLTDENLPSGSDRIWQALGKIDPRKSFDVVVNVQGDMPLLDPAIIKNALALLSNYSVDIATLACPIADEAEKNDPAVVKIAIAPPAIKGKGQVLGRALYFSRATIPHGDGPLYHHIGIYAYRRSALERFVSLPPSALEQREKLEQLRALEAGMRIEVALANTVPLGVDTPEGLEKARHLMEKKHG